MGGPMLAAVRVGVALSCILIMPMSLGGHMAGALDTSSDSHTAPPPRMSTGNIFGCQGRCMRAWLDICPCRSGDTAFSYPFNCHYDGRYPVSGIAQFWPLPHSPSPLIVHVSLPYQARWASLNAGII